MESFIVELKKRWLLLAVLAAYLGVGVLFAILIYGFGWDQTVTRWAARVFPLPAAVVNFEPIWLSSYYRRLEIIEHYAARVEAEDPELLPDDPTEVARQTLDQLIEITLLRQEATKAHLRVTDNEVMSTYKKLAEENGGEEAFAKVLLDFYNLTPFRFAKEFIPEQLYREKLQNELFTTVKVRHIVIGNEAQARDVLQKIKDGGDFAELAKQFSQDLSSRENGGDLGTIRREQVVDAFADAAFALEPGQISQDLVKTDFGYHIIKVEDKHVGQISDKTFAAWLDEVKAHAKVKRLVAKPAKENVPPSPEPTPQPTG